MEEPSDAAGPASSAHASSASGATQFGSIVELLMTVGHLDGVFDLRAQSFVQRYMDSVLLMVGEMARVDEANALTTEWRSYLETLYQQLEDELGSLAQGPGLDPRGPSALRSRALALFGALSAQDQEASVELIHGLIHADNVVTTAEQSLYDEVATSVSPDAPTQVVTAPTARMQALKTEPPSASEHRPMIVNPPAWLALASLSDPILDPLEQTYSPHPVERKSQIDWDYRLIRRAIEVWQQQRAHGTARLAGLSRVDQLPAGARFLDGRVYAMRPARPVELVVVGDTHGCYSCLKAALLQSSFVQRVWAHQWDPQQYPDVKLVLLGDYIDRGLFSFDGVLRAVLQLFVSMPDHVFVLRGNHEHLRWFDGRVISGVYPAEALASIAPHVPVEMLEAYRLLFEHMPTSLLCDSTLFVHGGIPRDDTCEAQYRDLSSLNQPDIFLQMMWSDPVQSQHIPVELQRQNPRFSFGHEQFRTFMERTGLRTLIRGHEKIDAGFEVFYDLGEHLLLSLFSAGGHDNCDLPVNSSYRTVTPMALTVQYDGNRVPRATPWPLQYQPFNYPPHNGLYRKHPLLEFSYV